MEKAFPAIVTKAKSQRVNSLTRSRAPKIAHPRRVGSTYLLSGLVKCHKCNRALSGQDAKSGQFSYYVCQSIMKRGKDACEIPRLHARRFEELVVGKIRSNVLTEGNIRALVKVVDEQMDGVAGEQRKRLETIEDELEDVKRKLGRIWHFVEMTDMEAAIVAFVSYYNYRRYHKALGNVTPSDVLRSRREHILRRRREVKAQTIERRRRHNRALRELARPPSNP